VAGVVAAAAAIVLFLRDRPRPALAATVAAVLLAGAWVAWYALGPPFGT
jgi:hypothetical protein